MKRVMHLCGKCSGTGWLTKKKYARRHKRCTCNNGLVEIFEGNVETLVDWHLIYEKYFEMERRRKEKPDADQQKP